MRCPTSSWKVLLIVALFFRISPSDQLHTWYSSQTHYPAWIANFCALLWTCWIVVGWNVVLYSPHDTIVTLIRNKFLYIIRLFIQLVEVKGKIIVSINDKGLQCWYLTKHTDPDHNRKDLVVGDGNVIEFKTLALSLFCVKESSKAFKILSGRCYWSVP